MAVRYDEGRQAVESWSAPTTSGRNRALHGLTRSLIANMVEGVANGYTKKLEIVGVGYQAQLKKANTVALQVGYANQVVLEAPPGVNRRRPRRDPCLGLGARQAGGRPSSRRRSARSAPPEPYKGKGIRYEGEAVRRKAGKGVRLEVSLWAWAPEPLSNSGEAIRIP